MKRRGVLAFILATAILASALSLFSVFAAEGVYFTAVNDTLKPLDKKTMPFVKDGVVYVSYTVFNDFTLGVYPSYIEKEYKLTLYNKDYQITFDSLAGVAYDRNEQYQIKLAGNSYGNIFVPIVFVCEKFGLTFNEIRTNPERTFRITSLSSVMSPEDFKEAKKASMALMYMDYVLPPSASGSTSPTVSQAPQSPPVVSPPPSPLPPKAIYLTFNGGTSEYREAILDELSESDVKATFFLTGADITAIPEQVRRIVGEGHAVGLLNETHEAGYASPDDLIAELRAANDALSAAVGTRTRLMRFSGGSKAGYVTIELRDAVIDAGYRYWDQNTDASDATATTASALARRVTNGLQNRAQAVTVVRMDASALAAEAMRRVLDHIAQNDYIIRTIAASEMPLNSWNDVRSTTEGAA